MKTYKFWIIWIKTMAIITSLIGLLMFTTAIIPKSEPSAIDNQVNIAFFEKPEKISGNILDLQAWHYGIASSMLISWGLIIALITHNALAKKEKWAWYTIMIALLTWFLFDQFASAYFHVTFNVVFNSIFFVLYFIPLIFIRKRLQEV